MAKTQRIQDAVHNLIEFDGSDFEQTCWKVLNTRPMQRLRRVKQLGFSEFVYPSATHSRFSHSVGVFHTARQLMKVIKSRIDESRFDPAEARVAMAAALVHDVGHGPLSHAFEEALKRLSVSKRHELRTRALLQQPDVIKAFEDFPDIPGKIAELIEAPYPKDIYASVVSSQFDADRLDYIRRDRMMSGTQQSVIDYGWLIANLQVRKVPIAIDGETIGKVDSLVIDDKSVEAAEGYIFGLFYLYKNVYYHKTTRGLEKIFSELIHLLGQRVNDGSIASLLPAKHPLVRFLSNTDDNEAFLELDDTVILGCLSLLAGSDDLAIADLARRIRDRKIYACVDVTKRMAGKFGLPKPGDTDVHDYVARAAEVDRRVARVGELAKERGLLEAGPDGLAGVLEDTAPRSPYKRVSDASRRLSRIHVIGADGELHDLLDLSPAVNALGDFKAYRMYARTDSDSRKLEQIIEDACA